MIPNFPNFKKIDLADKTFFDDYLKKFPPYSDFNFVSFWSYNDGDNQISLLHNNLVIKLPDYITNRPLYSFLGDNNVLLTITTLLTFLKQHNLKPEIKLLPEHSIINDKDKLSQKYSLKEDSTSFDYILSISKMATLEGADFKMHRNMVRKFEKEVSNFEFKQIDISDSQVKQEILELSYLWGERKHKTQEEIETELTAIKNLLQSVGKLNLKTSGIYIQGKLEAFYIAEVLPNNYAIGHFRKANTMFPGIFQYIDHKMSVLLQTYGCKYFNYEQDLGIESLRRAKSSWHPIFFLKKYVLSSY